MTDEHQTDPQRETSFEIGKDEAWFANVKRTYDAYLHLGLEACKRSQSHFDKVISDAQKHSENVNSVALQALQNAVETANKVGKQSVSHRDLAVDRMWNQDEVSALTAKSGAQADLIQAIAVNTAAAVMAAMKKEQQDS